MKKRIGALLLSLLCTTACGTGMEPLQALGDPSNSLIGTMDLPIAISQGLFASFQPFTSGTPYFTLNGNWSVGGVVPTIKAAANGVVSQVDLSGQSMTIIHNARISTQIVGVLSNVQVGSYVVQNGQIGTAVNSLQPSIRFSVLVDGVPVCPLSYLNTTSRQQFSSTGYLGYTQNPCQ